MRRWMRVFAVVLILAVLLPGCSQPAAPTESVGSPGETDKLVLYTYEGDTVTHWALPLYQKQYPEVEVEVVQVEREAYGERVAAELMSGGGPDVISGLWTTFPDLYKTMDSGAFLDLKPLMDGDGEFKREEYVEPVLEAGEYKGRQYLFPVDYMVPLLISERGILEKYGLGDLDGEVDYGTFWRRIVEAYPGMQSELPLEKLIADCQPLHFLATSGVSLVDRETGELLPQPEELSALTEQYKGIVYDCGVNEVYHAQDLRKALQDGKTVFTMENISPINYFTWTYGAAKALGDPVCIPLTGPDGKRHGTVLDVIGINANSKNVRNAWNFLKIAVSAEARRESNAISICRDGARQFLETYLELFLETAAQQYGEELTYTEEYFQKIEGLDTCGIYENAGWQFYLECMEPYFMGADTYETCLEQLRSRLTVYMSE